MGGSLLRVRAAAIADRLGAGAAGLLLPRGATAVVAGAIGRAALHDVTTTARPRRRGPLRNVARQVEHVVRRAALLERARLGDLAIVAFVIFGRARRRIPLVAVRITVRGRPFARLFPLRL